MTVGGVDVTVVRASFTGDLGYELHVKMTGVAMLYDALFAAGADLGLRDVGARAMDSLRLEKGYPRSGTELTADVSPLEVGLDFAVKFDKGDFIGREALLRRKQEGPRWELHMLAVDVDDSDAITNEPVLKSGEVVGVVTSGGYAHFTGHSLALALIKPDVARPGDGFEIEILGEERPAVVLEKPPFDAGGVRQRA
jgi:dimethylglycine dehydrogenase